MSPPVILMSPPVILILGLGFILWTPTVDCEERFRHTYGSSGEVCEGGFRKCLRWRASCVNGTCICKGGTSWKGNFACYPNNSYHAEVYNDPRLRTFARDAVEFPLSCRYLFSHFRTTFTGWNSSTCEVVIHAYNRHVLGKLSVYGFDLSLRISTPVTEALLGEVGEISFRQYATAIQGAYTFRESGTLNFRPDGPWELTNPPASIYMPETPVRMKYDPYNNFAYVQVDTCGFTARLRPFEYDGAYGQNQRQVPGLSLSVDPLHEPEWLSLDKVVALVPTGEPNLESISRDSGLEPEHAMLLRVAQSRVVQNQRLNAASEECDAFSDIVTSCVDRDRRKSAFETCTFILKVVRLKKCVSPVFNQRLMLDLFNRCFQSVCLKNTPACKEIQEQVSRCSHVLDHPSVQAFLLPGTCQFI